VKYKTFRMLMIGGALLLVLGGLGTCVVCAGIGVLSSSPAPEPPRAPIAPAPQLEPTPAPTSTATLASPTDPVEPGADSLAVTERDRAVLAVAKQNISGDKVKDALPGRAYKVNLYKDAGESKVNRLKVDLDRDDKWDEKWTFEDPDKVKRQIAPADDDNYTVEYRLEGEYWRKKR
jgi:hypothetical protein